MVGFNPMVVIIEKKSCFFVFACCPNNSIFFKIRTELIIKGAIICRVIARCFQFYSSRIFIESIKYPLRL